MKVDLLHHTIGDRSNVTLSLKLYFTKLKTMTACSSRGAVVFTHPLGQWWLTPFPPEQLSRLLSYYLENAFFISVKKS